MSDKEPKKIFKDDDPGTYDPKTKKHAHHSFQINRANGDITFVGKPPPDKFIPEGWVKVAENRWVSTWPACRFRRLDVNSKRNAAPEINPVCLHREVGTIEGKTVKPVPVSHDICNSCSLFEAVLRVPVLTEEEKDLLFNREYRDDLRDIEDVEDGVEVHINNEEYMETLEDGVYHDAITNIPPEHPGHPKNARKIHQKWNVPCIHRYQESKPDCSGCQQIMCNNPDAEKFGLKILRKDCKSCPVAEARIERT